MALFGSKKTRTARTVTLRAPTTSWHRMTALVRDRNVLLRLLICVVAILATMTAVEAWKAPFTYREGDRVEHGITARVEFRRENRFKTEQARSAKEAQVPYIFVNDPEPLNALPDMLRAAFNKVVKAESLDELDPQTRTDFGLTPPEFSEDASGPMPDSMHSEFTTFKARINSEGGTAGSRIDVLIDEFERFIVPIKEYGRAEPDELDTHGIAVEDLVAIANDPRQPLSEMPRVPAAVVRLNTALEETGSLGKDLPTRFPELNTVKDYLKPWLRSQVPITLRYDSAATNRARREERLKVDPIFDTYAKDDVLVEAGEVVNEETLSLLRDEYDSLQRETETAQLITRTVTVAGFVSVLAILNGFYIVYYEPQLAGHAGRLALYLFVMVVTVVLGRLLSTGWRAEIIPLLVTVMIFAIAYNQVLAVLSAFTLSLLITFSTVSDLGQFVVLVSVTATCVIPLKTVPSRSSIIKVGFLAAVVFFFVSIGAGIMTSQMIGDVWSDTNLLLQSLRGAGWCLVAGYLVAGSLPFVESTFGVVTDISLLEMSDVSHPLLQELVQRAPGTYNHSMTVATIAETAADRIGANGLLVRVGAYFHDIGKMLKPQYFIENVTEGTESGHAHLNPAMSTLVIIGHVKDGVDLARRENLPQPLIDFIEQHHGTTLVEYFFREATRIAGEQPDHKTDAEEASFRYPGPKPQSKEAGVMMLADCVESASRTLTEPTPKRIESLVRSLTMKRLLDGQFDESTLNLSEIHQIQESLIKSLIGIYHGRIKYPEQRTA